MKASSTPAAATQLAHIGVAAPEAEQADGEHEAWSRRRCARRWPSRDRRGTAAPLTSSERRPVDDPAVMSFATPTAVDRRAEAGTQHQQPRDDVGHVAGAGVDRATEQVDEEQQIRMTGSIRRGRSDLGIAARMTQACGRQWSAASDDERSPILGVVGLLSGVRRAAAWPVRARKTSSRRGAVTIANECRSAVRSRIDLRRAGQARVRRAAVGGGLPSVSRSRGRDGSPACRAGPRRPRKARASARVRSSALDRRRAALSSDDGALGDHAATVDDGDAIGRADRPPRGTGL